VAKPPAGSSLLFGALADSARIKQRKNGSYRMSLRGIDHFDWFTDRPDRVAGKWPTVKFEGKWNRLFADVQPNAQFSFEVGSKRESVTFEMFKPKLNRRVNLTFKIRGIDKKNKDLLTGLRNEQLSDASLFIDESHPLCLPNCKGADLSNRDLFQADLARQNLRNALIDGSYLHGVDLYRTKLNNANLEQSILSNARLSFAELTDVNLNSAYLHGADLHGADLYRANLTEANLSHANLTSADLTKVTLNGVNLEGARLSGSDLRATTWFDTTCPDGTKNSGTSPCTAEQLNLA
jgi:uncharacterized protein YjbI with pentapeptide repeats